MKKFSKVIALLLTIVLMLPSIGFAYTDTEGHWAEKFIGWAEETKIVSGYPDGTFKPNGNIKNVEFYSMVNKLKRFEETSDISFTDVPEDAWFYDVVRIAVKAGYIANGETLSPNAYISRDEVARIIATVYNLKGDEALLSKFNDKDTIVNKSEVAALADKGIIVGDDNGNFNPGNPIKRGEASKILNFAKVRLEKSDLLAGIGEDDLVILHSNDVHGAVEANDKNIGYAAYKNIIDEIKANHKRVLVIDAGDASQGSNFASISKGADVIKVLNNIGVDAFAPGNHEFDFSKESALENQKNSKFKWFASNVTFEDTGKEVFSKGEVRDVDGLKVGIFGMMTPETKFKASPKNTVGLKFAERLEDNVKIAQEEIDRLRADGAEVVVMISHLGLDESSEIKSSDIAAKVKGLNVIIDGHSHTLLEEGKKVGDVLIAQTGSNLQNIGLTTISPDGKAKSKMITRDEAYAYGEDEAIKSQISSVLKEQEKTLGVVVGKTATVLDGEREHVRAGETNLGNLITDAMKKASGADVVMTNGGGIRASIEAGDITTGDIFTVLPFGNTMIVIEVTGQDIVDALNHGAKDYPNPAGSFPHVAGLSFEIVEGKPSKVQNVKVNGEAIDTVKTYTLATNDFMAIGGDGYTMFEGKKQVSLFDSLANIVIEYIQELSKENPDGFDYKTEDRIVGKIALDNVA